MSRTIRVQTRMVSVNWRDGAAQGASEAVAQKWRRRQAQEESRRTDPRILIDARGASQ
jgi:hypothetical protein